MVQNSAFLDSETKLEKESKNTYRAWKQAITEPGEEFPPTPLPVLEGKIPLGLRGTLYRIGPGRLSRGGIQVGHWFDGDGAILRVHFGDDGATGLYRYVQTKGYQHEVAAGKLLYGNYGMIAPGRFWNHFLRPLKNVANTAVIALPDKLLALWEGGKPHALDLETLETKGIDNLGALEGGLTYSAHPKRDPQTGEIFNFGITGKFKEGYNHLAEFPMVPPLEIGQKWRYTYFLGFGKGTNTTEEFFNAIARIDYKTDSLTIADLGENRYPLEPTYVAYPMNPQSGWLLTIVYNGNIHTSEVWIFDSEHLNDEPVCKLGLPSVIPLGFHGIFNNYE